MPWSSRLSLRFSLDPRVLPDPSHTNARPPQARAQRVRIDLQQRGRTSLAFDATAARTQGVFDVTRHRFIERDEFVRR